MFILLAILAVAAAILMNWPCPELSRDLKVWRDKGDLFFYDNQRSIFYIDHVSENTGNTDILLLIHGFPTSSYDWVKLWPKLTGKFGRVVAFDMLGFGFSDKPVAYEYTIKEQATIALELLKRIGVTKGHSLHLMAHDYGDSVAQEIMARFNADELVFDVKSICLLNGGIFQETNHPILTQKVSALPVARDILGRLANRFLVSQSLSRTFGPKTQPTSQDMDEFWQLITYKNGHLVMGYLLGYMAERAENNKRWTAALSEATIPVHVIYGPEDLINPPPFIKYFKSVVPKGTIGVMKDIGHYPHWEDPETVWASYVDFIRPLLLLRG